MGRGGEDAELSGVEGVVCWVEVVDGMGRDGMRRYGMGRYGMGR